MPNKLILFIAFVIAFLDSGCGVKGDPVPPQRPAELGRGRPTYRRATERVPVQPQKDETLEEDDSDEDGVE